MNIWLAFFDGQTRYFLDINDSSVKPDVLRFRGREALSEPFKWDIEFTTSQRNISPEQVLMKYASFRMRSGKNVHGIITRLEWLSTSKDQSHYRLTLSSRLSLLGYTRQCALYQNQSVPEVVELVLRKHGLEGPDFEFHLERTYPPCEIITQWRETDLEFIQRILSEVGIYWRAVMDDVRSLDTYLLADSQLNYQFDVRLPYSEPSGLFDGAAESVWDVRTWHTLATGTVATRDYNYRTASTPMDYSETVSYDGVDIKAGAQAKTDEKTCENCPPEGKVMPMVRRCSRWSMVTVSYQTRICGTFYNPETQQIQEYKYCGVFFDGWKDKLCQFWEAKASMISFSGPMGEKRNGGQVILVRLNKLNSCAE